MFLILQLIILIIIRDKVHSAIFEAIFSCSTQITFPNFYSGLTIKLFDSCYNASDFDEVKKLLVLLLPIKLGNLQLHIDCMSSVKQRQWHLSLLGGVANGVDNGYFTHGQF